MVTKVTMPPRISRPTVEPRRVISKKRSKAFLGSASTVVLVPVFSGGRSSVLRENTSPPETAGMPSVPGEGVWDVIVCSWIGRGGSVLDAGGGEAPLGEGRDALLGRQRDVA